MKPLRMLLYLIKALIESDIEAQRAEIMSKLEKARCLKVP